MLTTNRIYSYEMFNVNVIAPARGATCTPGNAVNSDKRQPTTETIFLISRIVYCAPHGFIELHNVQPTIIVGTAL